MAQTVVYHQPTASQWASAAVHLENRREWRWLWIDGTRYVSIVSGRSNRVYLARADAEGCSCPFYQQTGRQCAHCLAIYLDATMEELQEQYDDIDGELELAFAEIATRRRGDHAGVALIRRYDEIDWGED